MKILHVLDRSLPNISGYSLRSNYILKFQKRLGVSVSAVTSPGQESRFLKEEIEGVIYYRTKVSGFTPIKLACRNSWLKSIIFMGSIRKRVEELVKKENIDIIHAHSPILCGLPCLAIGKKYNIPVVYEVRALWEDAAVDQGRTSTGSLRYRLSRYYETKLLKRAAAVVVICQGLKDEVISRHIGEDKVYVMPNGVDKDYFIPQTKDPDLLKRYDLNGGVIFGFIGSFFAFEGLELFVKAALRLLWKDDRIKIMIVGGGETEEMVRRTIKESRKRDSFILAGKVPHDLVRGYYSLADVMVYPRISHRLTELVTPLKPLEAMAMGKAVLASDVGGLKELVNDGKTGILFKADDAEDLAKKMAVLAADKTKRVELGKNARACMERHRDWSDIAEKYLSVYEGLLNSKGRRR